MTINVDLVKEIIKAVKKNPESFDMNNWWRGKDGLDDLTPATNVCGTTMCVAGWAVHLRGGVLLSSDTVRNIPEGLTPRSTHIEDVGAALLGLTEYQAAGLFYAGNRTALKMLEYMAKTGEYPPSDDV